MSDIKWLLKQGFVEYQRISTGFSLLMFKIDPDAQISKFKESVMSRGVPSKIIKFETIKQAQSAPSPATIFSLFYNEKFVTTDISICMDSRFDKLFEKESNRLL